MAEQIRERAQLKYVAIFRHAAGSHTALEELARASTLDVTEMAGVRAAGHAAVRGMRRFARRAVTLADGIHVVAAEAANGQVAAVIAQGASDTQLPDEVNSALVNLAQAAIRVLPPSGERTAVGFGYGARFADILAFLEQPPILEQSRLRLTHAVEQTHAAADDAAEIVETDLGLATAVLTAANRLPPQGDDGIPSVPRAIEALGARATLRLASRVPTLSPTTPENSLSFALWRLMPHSIAARSAADQIARLLCQPDRDTLRVAASLHDIGKVVLTGLRDGYLAELGEPHATPENRFKDEQRRLTIDHATIGALALRRLGLPRAIVSLVDRHHSDDLTTPGAIIRLADMLAHMSRGAPVDADLLLDLARRVSLSESALHEILYELQRPRGARVAATPSPLTLMQERALRGLANGKRYKQIASDMGLAESTVRSHVHNLYRKLGVADRAQAVLLASERGWI